MGKVYSLHLLSIKAGSSGEQFEAYFKSLMAAAPPPPPGLTMHLLKGDRGDRAGKYAVMIEFDSAERRTRLFPTEGPGAHDAVPETQQWMGAIGQQLARWEEYATPIDVIYTDYVDVSG